jgi:hypothetical protein
VEGEVELVEVPEVVHGLGAAVEAAPELELVEVERKAAVEEAAVELEAADPAAYPLPAVEESVGVAALAAYHPPSACPPLDSARDVDTVLLKHGPVLP